MIALLFFKIRDAFTQRYTYVRLLFLDVFVVQKSCGVFVYFLIAIEYPMSTIVKLL